MLATSLIAVAEVVIGIINVIGGVAVVISVALGLWPYVRSTLGVGPRPTISEVRGQLGRGLVLSLEIFIASDLIRSVIAPSLVDVAILAMITLVRIALSLSLEHEMSALSSNPPQTGRSPDP